MGLKRRWRGARERLARGLSRGDGRAARRRHAAPRRPQRDGSRGRSWQGAGRGPRGRSRARRTGAARGRRSRVSTAIRGGLTSFAARLRSLGRGAYRAWIALAEWIGVRVLAAWRRALRPLLAAVIALAVASYRFGLRHVTPARAVAVVGIVALAALVASQWLDYRVLRVGTEGYAGSVELVTPAPELDRARTGDAHGWLMLPLAACGLAAVGLALAGRPRVGRLLVPIGGAVIAVALLVDAPKGLDEGEAATAYEGARATLLEGFWLELTTGAVLIVCGMLLPRYLRPAPAGAGGPARDRSRMLDRARDRLGRRRRKGRRAPSGVEGART